MSEKMMKKDRKTQHGVAKVPVVVQLESQECGAACLSMILAYYKKWITLSQSRTDCGVSRDGVKASNILKAARKHGLEAKGYRYSVKTLQTKVKYPCIIHWNFNHFVVLDGFKKGYAIINDPAKGRQQISMELFNRSYTGICLTMEPGENFKPEGKEENIWGYARTRLKGTSSAIAIILLTSLATTLLGIIKPGVSRIFLDRLLPGKNPEWMTPFMIALVAFTVAEFIAALLSYVSLLHINGKFDAIGSSQYMWKILRLPMQFFSQRDAGDLMQRQTLNGNIASELITTVAPLFLNVVMLVFYLVAMIRYNVGLSMIGILCIGINLLVANLVAKKRNDLFRVMRKDTAKLQGATVSGIDMIETIKTSGSESGYFERWAGYLAASEKIGAKFGEVSGYLSIIPKMVTELVNVAVLILGVYLIFNGEFTVGMVMAFQGYFKSFMTPANDMINASQTIQEMRTEMEQLQDVMTYPDDEIFSTPKEKQTKTYHKLSGKIDMRHVTFGYSPLEEPLIRDFNLHVEPGKSVALVGASGCGKSTVTSLLSGLYHPWSGEVLLDDTPILDIDRNIFTGSLAVVDQEVILFRDTIANNIKMWDQSIEDFEMVLAARDAQIHEDIMQRDGGYQGIVLDGGKNFSGGQRQRLEIARVLAQDPTIIIMDEATSALDAKTEYNTVKAIRDRGITCVVVAHRLSTIRDCDEIIVLDHGVVVERGTHEELYKKQGAYTRLISNS